MKFHVLIFQASYYNFFFFNIIRNMLEIFFKHFILISKSDLGSLLNLIFHMEINQFANERLPT